MRIILSTVQLVLWNTALCAPQGPRTCDKHYQFPCKAGGCVAMNWVCDGDDDCGDRSDEDVCGPRCPKWSYSCANGVECYKYQKHCDGIADCSDGTDEFHCPNCPIGYTRCLAGNCVAKIDSCCPWRSEACAVTDVDDLVGVMKGSLIYANGYELFSLSLHNNSKRHLHRQEGFEIAALTYRAETNTIFWAAGPKIYGLALATSEDEVEVRGEIRAACLIVHMAYDWITGNFYLVCKHSRVLACTPRSGHGPMLCSKVISVDMKAITWLALDPNSGRMFIGGTVSSGSQIVESESDGSNARIIHQADLNSSFCFDPKLNEILIMKADAYGYLRSIDLAHDTERIITSKILQPRSTVQALFTNVIVSRRSNEAYGVFLAQNRTLIQWKSLDIEPTARLFHLIDPDTQPMGENPCDHLQCDNLCLLAYGGAVCKCGSFYTDDAGPCELRRHAKESTKIQLEHSGPRHTPVASGGLSHREDCFVHTMYLVTIVVVSAGCGAVLCYYLKRRKFCGAQAPAAGPEQSATFVAEGSSTALNW